MNPIMYIIIGVVLFLGGIYYIAKQRAKDEISSSDVVPLIVIAGVLAGIWLMSLPVAIVIYIIIGIYKLAFNYNKKKENE